MYLHSSLLEICYYKLLTVILILHIVSLKANQCCRHMPLSIKTEIFSLMAGSGVFVGRLDCQPRTLHSAGPFIFTRDKMALRRASSAMCMSALMRSKLFVLLSAQFNSV